MNKQFLDLCYELVSHYLDFPEVADTVKSILKGKELLDDYPNDDSTFQQRKFEIIDFIVEARTDNIIYTYRNSRQIFLPTGPGKTIYEDNIVELRSQLEGELSILTLKGIHQVIKRLYPAVNNDMLSEELLRQDVCTLQKYNIYNNEEDA